MKTSFKKDVKKLIDVIICFISAVLSVGVVFYGIYHFGLSNEYAQMGLFEHVFYLACVAMIWMHVFNNVITTKQFNYWCTLCLGITVALRDILFQIELANYAVKQVILILSVVLLCMLTYFYARKEWETYTKRNLWMIFIVDTLIAALYNLEIYLEPINEYTEFFLTAIWIRPTISYGLVACYIVGGEDEEKQLEAEKKAEEA